MRVIDADPTLAQRPVLDTSVSIRAHALEERLITDLTLGELAFCLRQGIALPQVAERAVAALIEQPLVDADGYPGDLLCSLLHAAESYGLPALSESELFGICSDALAAAEAVQELVVPAASAYVARR